ncbi:3-deoxy-7-phosphoheptulonate synthase [Flexivirga aerilata]|nr:3-deoxy-7-phosphoheptulonate synthase [Flexivirga aerilata]
MTTNLMPRERTGPLASIEERMAAALQQPQWPDPDRVDAVRAALRGRPALVRPEHVIELRTRLAAVAGGEAVVIQAGDCAEHPEETDPISVGRKVALISSLAGILGAELGCPVVKVGRIAGQFSKPRSRATELVDGVELTAYRGEMVNSQQPTESDRRPDPMRMLTGYLVASDVMRHLGWLTSTRGARSMARTWTSHEALLLDYELPMVRTDDYGRLFLASTHWPWVGARTRNLNGPHLELMSRIINPVAVKIGPDVGVPEIRELCRLLDPHRLPGRLTLISRMGAGRIGEGLPSLVGAVRDAGHPVIWMCDPMHGNTITVAGRKTRMARDIVSEAENFVRIVRNAGVHPGGLHLEATPDAVTECDLVDGPAEPGTYRTLCDPRLNPEQATRIASAWARGVR